MNQHLNFNTYDQFVRKLAVYPPEVEGLYPLIGLAGETGELIEKILPNIFNPILSSRMLLIGIHLSNIADAGIALEKLKKDLRKNGLVEDEKVIPITVTEDQREGIKKELGDILWYMAATAQAFGFSIQDVAQTNMDKLNSRLERGVVKGSGDNR